MTDIFTDFVENIMEIIIDDFSVYETSFNHHLNNLNKILQRSEDTNLSMNWEKCLFMVEGGIVPSHRISGDHCLSFAAM
jgi:hypothetical protein